MMKAIPAIAVLGAISIAASAQSQTLLRLKLQPGKTYRYGMSMDMSSPMTGSMKQTGDYLVKITKKVGDIYHADVSVQNTKIKAGAGSAMASQTSQAEQMANKTRLQGTYNSRGTQLSLKVLGGASAQGLSTLNAGFIGLEFPAAAVRAGSAWTMKYDISKMISAAMAQMPQMKVSGSPLLMKYTVKKIAGNNVTIASAVSGNVTMSLPQAQGGQTIKMTLSGGGTIMVDAATGLQKSSSMKINYNVTSPMKMTQTMTMTMTLK